MAVPHVWFQERGEPLRNGRRGHFVWMAKLCGKQCEHNAGRGHLKYKSTAYECLHMNGLVTFIRAKP